MTNQDIIRMAKEAGWLHEYDSPTGFVAEAAFKFAKIVAAAERKAILELADSLGWVDVDAIQARAIHAA